MTRGGAACILALFSEPTGISEKRMSAIAPLLNVVFPVMALVGVGFLYGRWKRIDPRALAEIVLFLLAPAVMFDALARQRILWEELLRAGAFSCLIQIVPGAIAWSVKRAAGMTQRAFVPSVMIMNAVSLPYPLALLAFGEEGLAHVVLLSIPNIFITFSLGIMAHGGGASVREPLRMPALYAAVAGIAAALAAIPIPRFILRFTHLTGSGMFPVELFALGYRLRGIRTSDFRISLLVSALRFGLGFLLAWALSEAFALEGAFRAALFLMSCSPPAVLNYVFAERYGREGSLAASIVFTGTALSLITTPLLLLYLGAGQAPALDPAPQPASQRLLEIDRRGAGDHRGPQKRGHHAVSLLIHPRALDAQHDGAGDSAQKGDQRERGRPERTQAQQVAHVVLGKARYREENEGEKGAPALDEEVEFLQNPRRDELLHEGAAQLPPDLERQEAPQREADGAENRRGERAVDIAAQEPRQLPRYRREDHLENLRPDEHRRPPGAEPVNPAPEPLFLMVELRQARPEEKRLVPQEPEEQPRRQQADRRHPENFLLSHRPPLPSFPGDETLGRTLT